MQRPLPKCCVVIAYLTRDNSQRKKGVPLMTIVSTETNRPGYSSIVYKWGFVFKLV